MADRPVFRAAERARQAMAHSATECSAISGNGTGVVGLDGGVRP